LLNLKAAPEFAAWLLQMGITDKAGKLVPASASHPLLLRP